MEADKLIEQARRELDWVCITDGFDNFISGFSDSAAAVLALRDRVSWTIDFTNRLTRETLDMIDNFS